jgi:hypothetical protein
MAFFSFCLFVGILIKRSAFAVGFIIVWYIVEKILYLVYGNITGVYDSELTIIGFLPLESMSNLLWEPFSRLEAYQTLETQVSGKETVKTYGIHWYEYLVVIAWTIFFMLMSYKVLKKRDL